MKADRENRRDRLLVHLVFSLLSLGVFVVLVWQLYGPVAAWFGFQKPGPEGLRAAAKYDGGNAAYHYLLGRHYQNDLADADAAVAAEHYRRALQLNPLLPAAWMDISKAYREQGNNRDAEHAFDRAVRLSPNNAELQWEAGTFYLMNNMTGKAVNAFRQTIQTDSSRQALVYDLCWKIGLANDYIIENVVPRSYAYQREYLKYLMAAGRVAESVEVWNRLERDSIEKDLFLSYVNFLIAGRSYDSAWSAWTEITGLLFDRKGMKPDEETSVWNQSFEQQMLNGGFDWIIGETEGVKVFIDESTRMTGSRSLGAYFDGRHNPDIVMARQFVRVVPGAHYNLKAYFKTESLTTSNGVFLQVRGHECEGLDRSSDALTGSNFWREVSIDFDSPSNCNAVTVMMRRARSGKLDNKIEGTAWIDGVTLKQQSIIGTTGSRKP